MQLEKRVRNLYYLQIQTLKLRYLIPIPLRLT